MNVARFISTLESQGITLWLDGEQLRYQAPEGAMTPALRTEIGAYKADILTFLHQVTQLPDAPIQPVSRAGDLPLSFAQERLWILTQLEGGAGLTYNVPVALYLTGDLNRAALERSLNDIGQRHEALRTTFPQIDGQARQQINAMTFHLPWIALDTLPPEHQETEVQRLVEQEAKQPFDLGQGPLWRSALLQLSAERHILLLTLHHIVSDGWSWDVLTRELSVLYNAYLHGQPASLPPLDIQYADFSVWQREWLSGTVLEAQLDYWKAQLAESPARTTLPTDHPRPAIQNHRGSRHAFALSQELTDQLKQLSQRASTTLFMTLEAALAILLSRYAGQDDILIGTPIANRQRLELAPLIGLFANTLVLRNNLSGNPPFHQFLTHVRQMALDAYRYQDVPFELLVDTLQPERSLSHNPLFQVMFSLQEQEEPIHLHGLTTTSVGLVSPAANFDLTLIMEMTEEGLRGWWEYSNDLFEAETIVRLTDHLQVLLSGIVANPDQCIGALPLLTAAEHHQLLVAFNDTAADGPHSQGVHQRFEQQAARTPDAVAVVFEDHQLTYRELNRRANQLAHDLMELGVGPDGLVGIYVERSLDMVVGVLGVLKAGGAYVPLDPNYPPERLAFMLEDAQVRVLLTQERLIAALPVHHATLRCLDIPRGQDDPVRDDNPIRTAAPHHLAYVIYTSGSTGQPKGVLVTHLGLCNLTAAQIRIFDVRPESRVFQIVSFSFDVATSDLFMALCAGAALILASHHYAGFNSLSEDLYKQAVTHMELPASILTSLPFYPLPALQTIIVGGEVCPPDVISQWAKGRRFFNAYGPTEATICTAIAKLHTADFASGNRSAPIGRPIDNTQVYILDAHLQPVPIGVPGELHIGGMGLARGYWKRPGLTVEKFIPNPFGSGRLYKTGDLCCFRPDGNIEFLGRIDHQVKIRGFRIELTEIETILNQHPALREAVVMAREDEPIGTQLVAYVVAEPGGRNHLITPAELSAYLAEKLPHYMVPAAFVPLDALPLTPNGKIDRHALPAPTARVHLEVDYVQPQTEVEQHIAAIWQAVLQIENVGIYDNFFDLGGNSLLVIQVHSHLQKTLKLDISVTDLFQYPTVDALATYLSQTSPTTSSTTSEVRQRAPRPTKNTADIAVIGMSCRFPGASSVERFWHNLRHGIESVSVFSDEELLAAGVDPALLADPNYVKAGLVLPDIDRFDAAFFDFTPREASTLDPQQRLFLECAQEVLETVGYDPGRYAGAIGVYAGAAMSLYLLDNLYSNPEWVDSVGDFQLGLGNDCAFLPTRVAYKLNLKGPGVGVQTACSTSLVAVHLACQSLRHGECDIALAGGVTILLPQHQGYLYQDGMIFSPDGHCRAFDANAQGTLSSNGLGIVALKRLEEALEDGDTVYAVIKGSAINNDGAVKVGYTAPSIEGQAQVIREAQAMAGVEPETITYVEAHGTATELGDPIEIAALTQAFQSRLSSDTTSGPQPWCAIGSVKTNIGHTDNAAGVAGLIKTVLALQHRQLPPSLHFESPNPNIDFANSPFYVNATLNAWPASATPRRAGVSSFGIGGTNAHVVLEEAPMPPATSPSRPWQLLVLSAKTSSALDTTTTHLADHLEQHPEVDLADVAYTLLVGRQAHPHRRMLVCEGRDAAISALRHPQSLATARHEPGQPPVVFMFPGQGTPYVNMAKDLYEHEPTFRHHLDTAATLLQFHLGIDVRHVLYPEPEHLQAASAKLEQTAMAQPALFLVAYALAQLWQSWGVRPQAMIGHSLGEYVAACLAGVLSLEDALRVVVRRGQLMQSLPPGAMLAVQMSEADLRPRLAGEPSLSLAAVNGPSQCVVSGPEAAIARLQHVLEAQGMGSQRLSTSHAFHSAMMEPIVEAFTALVASVTFRAPQVPYISNVSGDWIEAQEATDPSYWARHLRQAVRFGVGLERLCGWESGQVWLEVGPGRTLSALSRGVARQGGHVVLRSMRHVSETHADAAFMLETLGQLWLSGVGVEWPGFYTHERRQRRPLPTYPFERQRYWVEPATARGSLPKLEGLTKQQDLSDWFHIPSWERSALPAPLALPLGLTWLFFNDEQGLGDHLAKRLEQAGQDVIIVQAGTGFAKRCDNTYTLHPQHQDDYDTLLQQLLAQGKRPHTIVHLWRVTSTPQTVDFKAVEEGLTQGFYSLLFLAQALGSISEPTQLVVITNHMQEVTGAESLCPEKATILGPIKVIPEEFPNIHCRSIDIAVEGAWTADANVINHLMAELMPTTPEPARRASPVIAYRGKYRWEQTFKPIRLGKAPPSPARIRPGGVYLITGGLGGIGLVLAEHLASFQAKLILIGRSAFPARETWGDWLATHAENDAISRNIHKLQAFEAAGAEVLVQRADVASPSAVQVAVECGIARFGPIHGVIHTAGVPGGGIILRKTRAEAAAVLASKVQGTLVLADALRASSPDFMVLCSSLNAILGGFGQVDYAAANAFLDAFAHHSRVAGFTVAVNWGTWQEVGIVANTIANANAPRELLAVQAENLKHGILPGEGRDVFDRILASRLPQVVVSTQDFQQLQQASQEPSEPVSQVSEPESLHARSDLHVLYVAPQDRVEALIAEVWQQYLGIEPIGIHDHFFEDLAGDSLNGTRLVNQLQKQLGAPIPIAALFGHPTVAEMGAYIKAHHPQTLAKALGDIRSEAEAIATEAANPPTPAWIPLLATQRPLIPPETAAEKAYVNCGPQFSIRTEVDIPALRRTCQALAARHEALRLRVARRDGTLMQQVHSEAIVPFEVTDASGWSDEQLAARVAAVWHDCFDLAQEPPLRVYLFTRAPNDHILVILLHHIASDGWSIPIIWEELERMYEAQVTGQPTDLAPLTWSFTDYLRWQHEMLSGPEGEQLWHYWQQYLSGPLPALNLPTDYPRPSVISHRGAGYTFHLASDLTQRLKALGQIAGATPYVLVQASLQLLLHGLSGQREILVGATIHNRVRPELERLVGSLVDAMVLRSTLPDDGQDLTFMQYLSQVQTSVSQGLAHQGYPSLGLAERLERQENAQGLPLVQVSLNYLHEDVLDPHAGQPEAASRALALDYCELPVPIVGTWDEDIILGILEQPDGLHGIIRYNTDLFAEATIASMAGAFQTLLWSVLSHTDRPISILLQSIAPKATD